jgi:hypothetical protein
MRQFLFCICALALWTDSVGAQQWLKQSTPTTVKIGPFVDVLDGDTAESGLTIQKADVRLSKNGGDYAAANADQGASDAGAPHDELGEYDISLNGTDTNTPGLLKISIKESGALRVWKEFMVVPANVHDSLVGQHATDKLQTDVVQMSDSSAPVAQLAEAFDNDGTGGDMDLSSLSVTDGATVSNSFGTALTLSGAAGKGLSIIGSGSVGASITGSGGHALELSSTGGSAIDARSSTNPAVYLSTTGTNHHGFEVSGNGTGSGIRANGGPNGSGLSAVGTGTGHGPLLDGGATGDDILMATNDWPGLPTLFDFFLDDGAASYDRTTDSLQAQRDEQATIKAKTDNLPPSPAAIGSAMTLASGAVTSGTFSPSAIDAAAIANNAIDRATFAGDTGLQSVRSGAAQSGSTTSIALDASASAVTDFYKHNYVYVTGGAGAGQYRLITGYNGTTKVATVTPAWITSQEPASGSTFAILPAGIANVEAWFGAPVVVPTVLGVPEVDVTHVSGEQVCD